MRLLASIRRPVFSMRPSIRQFIAPRLAHHTRRSCIRIHAQMDAKALKDTASLDQLIDLLLQAKSQNDLTQLVAENILSFDQRFWLRIATRNDSASSREDKDKLGSLANTVMVLVDAIVRKAETQMTDSGAILQTILTSVANEKGEWTLPLSRDQYKRLRTSLDENAAHVNETLLATTYSYLKKASDDKKSDVVALLQKVLQAYASRELATFDEAKKNKTFLELLDVDEAEWEGVMRARAKEGMSEAALGETVQRLMEATVLRMQSGSYAQRVMAEYLKEVEGRAKEILGSA